MKHLSPEATYLLEDIKNLLPNDPDDPYEKVLYWEYLLEVLTALQEEYIAKKEQEIQHIQQDGITSTSYVLEVPVRNIRTVDIKKLKILYPDLYSDLVFIGPHDITRIIGKKALHSAVVELLGEEAAAYERVNITELQTRLSHDELTSCITITRKELPPVITTKKEGRSR